MSSVSLAPSPASQTHIIRSSSRHTPTVFITDAEGNFDFFAQCVHLCAPVLQWRDDGCSALQLSDGCAFVFGGDVCDKWSDSIRLVSVLLEAKRTYPDRVFLLLGNRDMNKVRLINELQPSLPSVPLDNIPPSVDAKQFPSTRAFLLNLARSMGVGGSDADAVAAVDSKPNRLRYILTCTMGAPEAFEFCRTELAASGRPAGDDDVVACFCESVCSGGHMRRYIEAGQLAVCIDCNLFVHGGLYNADGVSLVDFYPVGIPSCRDVTLGPTPDHLLQWLTGLNQWIHRVADANAYNEAFGFWYGKGHESVMLGRMLDKSCRGMPPPQSVVQQCNAWGIYRVLCGHTPIGALPSVYGGPLQVVAADTGRSDNLSKDFRGGACSSVIVTGPSLVVRGVMPNITDCPLASCRTFSYSFVHALPPALPSHVQARAAPLLQHIGSRCKDGFTVRALLDDDAEQQQAILCLVDGFKYQYKVAAVDSLQFEE